MDGKCAIPAVNRRICELHAKWSTFKVVNNANAPPGCFEDDQWNIVWNEDTGDETAPGKAICTRPPSGNDIIMYKGDSYYQTI